MSAPATSSESERGLAAQPRGLAMARTREGHELPVIDVTDPRFAVPDDPAATRALYDEFIDGEQRRHRIPKFIMRVMLRAAGRKSRLVRALFNSDAGYLDRISTYVLKLGADQLVPALRLADGPQVAASPHVTLIRLRMQQIARLLADGLVEPLADAPARRCTSINIGGGPALDSINALIMLRARRTRPDPASGRRPRARLAAGWTVVRRQRARRLAGGRPPAARARRRTGSTTTTTGTPRRLADLVPISRAPAPSSPPRRRAPVRVRRRRCDRRQPGGATRRGAGARLVAGSVTRNERGAATDDREDGVPAHPARARRLRPLGDARRISRSRKSSRPG